LRSARHSPPPYSRRALSVVGVRYWKFKTEPSKIHDPPFTVSGPRSPKVLAVDTDPQSWPPCSPISQVSGQLPSSEGQRSPPSVRTTSDRRHPVKDRTVAADPRAVSCTNGFGHRQAIHILLHRGLSSHKDRVRLDRHFDPQSSCQATPPRSSTPRDSSVSESQIHLWFGPG
jgi:hypothetical protein